MATVALVVVLERELGMTLPESSLTAATFVDAAGIWRKVSKPMRP
jgi:hypothetical protein